MTAAQGHVGFTLYNAFWQPSVESPSSMRASCSCRACSLVRRDRIWWSVWMSQSPSVSLKSRLISLAHPETQAVDPVGSHSRHLCSPSILLCLPVSPTTVCRLCVYCVRAPGWLGSGAESRDPALPLAAVCLGGMECKGALFLAICQWGSKKMLSSNPSAYRGWLGDFSRVAANSLLG